MDTGADCGPGAVRPPDAKAKTLDDVQVVATAIETLLDAGEIKAADELYRSRLRNGRVFTKLPAPQWGMELAWAFLRTEARREALARDLGPRNSGAYFNAVGFFGDLAGESDTAFEFYAQAVKSTGGAEHKKERGITLRNLSHGLAPN